MSVTRFTNCWESEANVGLPRFPSDEFKPADAVWTSAYGPKPLNRPAAAVPEHWLALRPVPHSTTARSSSRITANHALSDLPLRHPPEKRWIDDALFTRSGFD